MCLSIFDCPARGEEVGDDWQMDSCLYTRADGWREREEKEKRLFNVCLVWWPYVAWLHFQYVSVGGSGWRWLERERGAHPRRVENQLGHGAMLAAAAATSIDVTTSFAASSSSSLPLV